MQELAPLIKDLALILGVASVVILLFQKIRQPIVLGYLVAGMIVGPYTPPHTLVSDIPNIQTLSELGVIFLMFSLGLEFSFHKLKRVGFSAVITGIFEVAFMLMIGLGVGLMVGWSFYDSLFLGAALAISSTTIIVKALDEMKLKGKRFAETIVGILVVEDLLAILLLVGLSTLVLTKNIISVEMVAAITKLVLVVGGWFFIGYFLVPPLFRKIMYYASEETIVVVAIALCLILVCAAAHFHYSVALGAFMMGSILAETTLVHRIAQLIGPIRDIFAAVFFISVGMLIDPHIIVTHWPIVILLCLTTIVGKLFATGAGTFLTGLSINNSVRIGFSMAQIGEFSFIIAGLGVSLNATSSTLFPILVAVSAITTFLTPYFIRLSANLGETFEHSLPKRMQYFLENYTAWVYRQLAQSNDSSGYRKAIVQFLVNGILVGIIFTVMEHGALKYLFQIIEPVWLAKIVGWCSALIISLPFVWAMLAAFHALAKTNESQSRITLQFMYLSWALTVLEVLILSITYFDTWLMTGVFLGVGVIFYILLSRRLEHSYRWFEKRFKRNFTGNAKRQVQYEALAPWDSHLVEIEVKRRSTLIGKSLQESQLRERFNVNIVAIQRGDEIIFAPTATQIIFPLDNLIVLGSDETIEKLIQECMPDGFVPDDHDFLDNFYLHAVVVDEHSELADHTIRAAQTQAQSKSIVVGLERNGKQILNPSADTLLLRNDLVLVVSEKHA